MKKRMVWVIAAVLLFVMLGALAEEGQEAPLYATVGEAMQDDAEGRVISGGVPGDYYAVVNRKNGQFFRSVALWDEKLTELNDAVDALDFEAPDFFEKHEAAMQAADDYLKTLPIAYSEMFTAPTLTEEEMAAMHGKTLAELTGEGFEIGSHGTEPGEGDEPLIVYSMRYGVYDYSCLVDADFDQYMEAQDNGTEGDLVVTDVTLAGVTEWGADKRFHTDGTVEEPEDPFAEIGALMTDMMDFVQKALAGEAVDIEAFAAELKEKYPDYAEMIDFYVSIYQAAGAEGLASLMTPAE